MANEVWFEIGMGGGDRYPSAETVRPIATRRARDTDDLIEIYRVTRTLIHTVQRSVSVSETDVP
jgi:hypothetical protein